MLGEKNKAKQNKKPQSSSGPNGLDGKLLKTYFWPSIDDNQYWRKSLENLFLAFHWWKSVLTEISRKPISGLPLIKISTDRNLLKTYFWPSIDENQYWRKSLENLFLAFHSWKSVLTEISRKPISGLPLMKISTDGNLSKTYFWPSTHQNQYWWKPVDNVFLAFHSWKSVFWAMHNIFVKKPYTDFCRCTVQPPNQVVFQQHCWAVRQVNSTKVNIRSPIPISIDVLYSPLLKQFASNTAERHDRWIPPR